MSAKGKSIMDGISHLPATAKATGELISLSVIFGALVQILPAIAALIAILWHCLLIYDWIIKKINTTVEQSDAGDT